MELKSTIFFILSFSLASLISLPTPTTATSQPISAVFAFGDSTVDSGNNNGLLSTFRSDHLPYGRDMPNQFPSGRFSNGMLATDFMVANLGLKPMLPAYLDPNLTDGDLLTGVSFGSGGSGLDDVTVDMTGVLSLITQLEYFDQTLQRMDRSVGAESRGRIVENAVFVISTGTNDMLLNVYETIMPFRSMEFGGLSRYQDFLLQRLGSFIQILYRRGARRFQVAGLPPIGCLPAQQTLRSVSFLDVTRRCNEQQNADSQAYNDKLQRLLSRLQPRLPAARLAYFDTYNPLMDMIINPRNYGIEQTHLGCCGTGLVEMGPLCNNFCPMCYDASKYLFWDSVHPSQAAYWVLADFAQRTIIPQLTA